MSIFDDEELQNQAHSSRGKRRDPSKVGVAKAWHDDYCGRMYIPQHLAEPGQFISFVEAADGLAFKIGSVGQYRIRIQNGATRILICPLHPCMNKYAPEKAVSVDIEDFEGGYLIRYSQFQK